MRDEEKSREQLIQELNELRRMLQHNDRQANQGSTGASNDQTATGPAMGSAHGEDPRIKQAKLDAEDAEDRAVVAEKARNIAEKARDVAERARDIAEETRKVAEQSRGIAEKALTVSEHSQKDLEEALVNLAGLRDGLLAAQKDLQSKLDSALKDLEAMGLIRNGLAQQLQARTEDLGKALVALRDYAARLERSNAELQDFAFVASHDLQEPLRKIQAFSERLLGRWGVSLGEEGCDYLRRMQSAANRMSSLIAALLAYSRVATRGQPFKPIDLANAVHDAESDLELTIQNTNARLQIGSLPSIEADPDQMRQLFQNLIGNALKYRREDEAPRIRIHGSVENGVGHISIEDNGIGFDEKYLERIFKPLQRLHSRSAFEGTGMGLAICRRIVERHGGAITARSTPGVGSTFIVSLPLKQQGNEGDELTPATENVWTR